MTATRGTPPAAQGTPLHDAVVLAGGAAKRLGGADKPAVRVGGRALLDRVLAACSGASTTVVVAEPRPTVRPVVWAREEPPGGGPLAALAAGLRLTTAKTVLVLSADLPFLDRETVRRLLTTLEEAGTSGAGAAGGVEGAVEGAVEGVLLTDPGGRDQPLVAVYRSDALRRELAVLDREHDGVAGLPLRRLTAQLVLDRIPDVPSAQPAQSAGPGAPGLRGDGSSADSPVAGPSSASFDCDTWEDIATARARIREHGHVLDEWISAVKDELGIELDVDTAVLLDLARDAAHGVARPAAPLTTFLVGYAAGRAEGGPEVVAEATRKAVALAARWAEEAEAEAGRQSPQPDAG